MDSNTSLGEKIRTLFRQQGITIASILMAIGMAIGVLVEALLPGGGGTATSGGGEPPPKDEKGLKEWIRNKLKSLLQRTRTSAKSHSRKRFLITSNHAPYNGYFECPKFDVPRFETPYI